MRSYFHFEMLYDCHFEMRGQNFRTQNCFRQENPEYFIDEKAPIITIFRTQLFTQGLVPILVLK